MFVAQLPGKVHLHACLLHQLPGGILVTQDVQTVSGVLLLGLWRTGFQGVGLLTVFQLFKVFIYYRICDIYIYNINIYIYIFEYYRNIHIKLLIYGVFIEFVPPKQLRLLFAGFQAKVHHNFLWYPERGSSAPSLILGKMIKCLRWTFDEMHPCCKRLLVSLMML